MTIQEKFSKMISEIENIRNLKKENNELENGLVSAKGRRITYDVAQKILDTKQKIKENNDLILKLTILIERLNTEIIDDLKIVEADTIIIPVEGIIYDVSIEKNKEGNLYNDAQYQLKWVKP